MDRQILFAKKEVTYGTDAVVAAADAVWAENVKYKPGSQRNTPDVAKPTLSAQQGQVFGQYGEISFDVQMSLSGVAGTAPKWGKLLKAAGYAEDVEADESVTYTILPDPLGSDSLTIVWRDARRKHQLLGARGKIDLKLVAGQPPRLSFLYRGLYVPLVTAATVAAADANFTGWSNARVINQARTTFDFNGEEIGLRDLSVTGKDNVKFADLPGQRDVRLAGARELSGSIKATMPLASDLNPETLRDDETIVPWSVVHGTVAGSILTVNGKGQLGDPDYMREDEVDCFASPLFLCGSTPSTDDDLSIVCT